MIAEELKQGLLRLGVVHETTLPYSPYQNGKQESFWAGLEGVRFEVPNSFRHLERITLRYARWNLCSVDLVDDRTGTVLSPLYPQDKGANADGRRRILEPSILSEATPPEPSPDGVAPLLRKLLRDYAVTGIPPAYLPKIDGKEIE
jgi:hypothetical protein